MEKNELMSLVQDLIDQLKQKDEQISSLKLQMKQQAYLYDSLTDDCKYLTKDLEKERAISEKLRAESVVKQSSQYNPYTADARAPDTMTTTVYNGACTGVSGTIDSSKLNVCLNSNGNWVSTSYIVSNMGLQDTFNGVVKGTLK